MVALVWLLAFTAASTTQAQSGNKTRVLSTTAAANAGKTCPLKLNVSSVLSPSSDHITRIAVRDWLSQEIVVNVLEIALKASGHRVEIVDMRDRSTSKAWTCDLAHYDCAEDEDKYMVDTDPEFWRFSTDIKQYRREVRREQRIFDAGPTGFVGQSGLYFAPAKLQEAHPHLLVKAAQAHAVLPAVRSLFPVPFPDDGSTGATLGIDWQKDYKPWTQIGRPDETGKRWVPPVCDKKDVVCADLYHVHPSWDSGDIESLVLSFEMPYRVHYLGSDFAKKVQDHFSAGGAKTPMLHYWFNPDPLLQYISADRVVFPSFLPGCNGVDLIGYRGCDFKYTDLAKAASARLRRQAATSYLVLQRLHISTEEIGEMLLQHVRGGGQYTTTSEVACWFAQKNAERVAKWIEGCQAGFKLDTSDLSCVPNCAAGNEVSASKDACQLCSPGRHQPVVGAPCVDCSPGRYATEYGAVQCNACSRGTSAPNSGSTNCTNCTQGTYGEEAEMAVCKNCSAGTYGSEEGQSACLYCPVGTFISKEGQTTCESCSGKGLVTEILGAKSDSSCVCAAGMFFNKKSSGCAPCPTGMSCQTTFGKATPLLKPGYMSFTENPLAVYKCSFDSACAGIRDPYNKDVDICTGNHEGTTCFRCEEGYSSDGDECVPCKGEGTAMPFELDFVLGAFVVLGVCTALYYENLKLPTAEKLIVGMLLEFLQDCAVLGNFALQWPLEFKILIEAFSILQFKMPLRMECITGASFALRFFSRILWPLVMHLGFTIIWLFWRLVYHIRKGNAPDCCISFAQRRIPRSTQTLLKEFWPIKREDLINCMLISHFELFTATFMVSMSIFDCTAEGYPEGKSQVAMFPDVECQSERWMSVLPVGIISILLYCITYLAIYIWIIIQAPKRVGHDEVFTKTCNCLWDDWHPGKYWFGVIQLGFAVVLNLIAVFGTTGTQQVYLAQMLIICYLVIVNQSKPWRYWQCNLVDGFMKFVLAFLLSLSAADSAEDNLAHVLMLIFPWLPLIIAATYLSKVLFAKHFAKTKSHLERMQLAQRFRDVMCIAGHTSNGDFLKLVTCELTDDDRIDLYQAHDALIATVLRMQASDALNDRRIITGVPFEICTTERMEKFMKQHGIVHRSPAVYERNQLRKVARELSKFNMLKRQRTKSGTLKDCLDDDDGRSKSGLRRSLSGAAESLSRKSLKEKMEKEKRKRSGLVHKQLFDNLDNDKDGVLSKEEFTTYLSGMINRTETVMEPYEIDEVFDSLDLDDNGEISVDEFCAVLQHYSEEADKLLKQQKLGEEDEGHAPEDHDKLRQSANDCAEKRGGITWEKATKQVRASQAWTKQDDAESARPGTLTVPGSLETPETITAEELCGELEKEMQMGRPQEATSADVNGHDHNGTNGTKQVNPPKDEELDQILNDLASSSNAASD